MFYGGHACRASYLYFITRLSAIHSANEQLVKRPEGTPSSTHQYYYNSLQRAGDYLRQFCLDRSCGVFGLELRDRVVGCRTNIILLPFCVLIAGGDHELVGLTTCARYIIYRNYKTSFMHERLCMKAIGMFIWREQSSGMMHRWIQASLILGCVHRNIDTEAMKAAVATKLHPNEAAASPMVAQ